MIKRIIIYARWNGRELAKEKYPTLTKLVGKYLHTPAIFASSGRMFSTTGNIVGSRRTSLLLENPGFVNIFL